MVMFVHDYFRMTVKIQPESDPETDFASYCAGLQTRLSSLGLEQLAERADMKTLAFGSPIPPIWLSSEVGRKFIVKADRMIETDDGLRLEFDKVPELTAVIAHEKDPLWGRREIRSGLRKIVGRPIHTPVPVVMAKA